MEESKNILVKVVRKDGKGEPEDALISMSLLKEKLLVNATTCTSEKYFEGVMLCAEDIKFEELQEAYQAIQAKKFEVHLIDQQTLIIRGNGFSIKLRVTQNTDDTNKKLRLLQLKIAQLEMLTLNKPRLIATCSQTNVRWESSKWAPITSVLGLIDQESSTIQRNGSQIKFQIGGRYWIDFHSVGWNKSGLRGFRLRKKNETLIAMCGYSTHEANGGFFQHSLTGSFRVSDGEEVELQYVIAATGNVLTWSCSCDVDGDSIPNARLEIYLI